MPADSQLTPFVDTQRNAGGVVASLGTILGVAQGETIEWEELPEVLGDWSLLARISPIGGRAVELELGPTRPGGRAWFRGAHLSLGYRRGRDGVDPLTLPEVKQRLDRVIERVRAADRLGPDSGPLADLRASLTGARAWRGIRDSMFRKVTPREASIRLGFRCNQDCGFCWQGRDWPEPPRELYHTWLDEMAALGKQRVIFTGGEPTIHPALVELVERAHRVHGMEVEIQTNAIRLARPDYLRQLVEAGLDRVFVSFHSHDAETSDRMTRAPRTHLRTVAGVEACLRAGLRVLINCVVERQNYTRLEEHARFVVERFVRAFPENPALNVQYSHPCMAYEPEVWRQAVVPLDELRPHLLAALGLLATEGVPTEAVGTCGFPPCLLRDAPAAVLGWFDPEEEEDSDVSGRLYGEACGRCAVRNRCLGLRREYLDVHGERGIVPFDTVPPGF